MIEEDPRTKQDLVRAFGNLAARDLQFWIGIAPERFARGFGQAWSPADTVRHLTKSTLPVARALRIPKLALRVLFGKAEAPSRSYADLVGRYRTVLAAGGQAGRFAPSPMRPPADLPAWQHNLVYHCQSAVASLSGALDSWSDANLDRCHLPHPLLGKLTVREMLFFTLYHFEHHRTIIERRLATAAEPTT